MTRGKSPKETIGLGEIPPKLSQYGASICKARSKETTLRNESSEENHSKSRLVEELSLQGSYWGKPPQNHNEANPQKIDQYKVNHSKNRLIMGKLLQGLKY